MPRVSGITIQKVVRGNDFNLIINYRKHPELVNEILERQQIENPSSPYDAKFVKKILSQKNAPSVTIDTKDLWK